MTEAKHFLPDAQRKEISDEIAELVRCAVVDSGLKEDRIVVIGQINIQVNYATGGGAKVVIR